MDPADTSFITPGTSLNLDAQAFTNLLKNEDPEEEHEQDEAKREKEVLD